MSKRAAVWSPLLGWLVVLFVLAGLPALATDPARLVKQIRTTTLQPARAVSLSNVELEIGPGRLQIDDGVLVPATTEDGQAIELVFIGRARFRMDAPDAIEARQLEIFTGRRSIDAPVEEAVLVLSRSSAVESLLDGPAPHDLQLNLLERAKEIHGNWLLKPERRTTGVESGIYKSLVNDAAFRDYFALWANSYELGEFVFQLDPEDLEQITVARFTPIDVRGWERVRLARHIRIQQRKGRWLGVRLEDIGAWDIWVSTSWAAGSDPDAPGSRGFEPEHYEVDLTLLRDALRVQATSRIYLRAEESGRTTLSLDLFRDLEVESIVDREGRELFFFRSGKEIIVQLPEPTRAGQRYRLEVAYGGRVMRWVGTGTFDLDHTATWHPHCGTVDRATYDVTIRWPKKYTLISSGQLVDSGRDGWKRWERRRIEIPTAGFSFAVGKFLLEQKQIGHVSLKMAFSRAAPVRLTPETMERAMDTVARSLSYFEQVFGPYPLDELAVVALPRRYSQSYLGFITLTDTILYGPTQDHGFDTDAFRDTLVAHEVAHQWWGNMVGWWSYRDQWLSEATANYAGLLFYDQQQGEGSTYLAEMSAGWRESLSQRTADGRTIESLGPVVLGGRLNSSLSNSAYQEIVYRKGAVVLAMLARAVGEEAFLRMLHEVIDAAKGKVLTTDSFIQAIERMSGLDLAGFAQQYIYGTGVPRVYYRYAKEPDVEKGGWTVRGEAHLLGDPGFELAVTRNMSGEWDIERTPKRRPETESTAMMVPSRVVFASAEGSTNRGSVNRRDTQWHNLFIRGQDDRFEIRTDKEPETLHLDPHGEILARFYDEERHPKRCLRYAAQDLLLEGKFEQAETMYHQALTAESGEPTLQDGRSGDLSRDGSREDARIHLDLARLYLDQARLEPAGEQLRRAEDLLASDSARFRMEREVLASRLDVRNRDYDSAYRRLRKTLRLMSTGDAVRSWRSMRVRLRLSSEREAVREAFALFAIAAFETDNPEDLAWANREARDRGVDVLLLDLASADSRRP